MDSLGFRFSGGPPLFHSAGSALAGKESERIASSTEREDSQ